MFSRSSSSKTHGFSGGTVGKDHHRGFLDISRLGLSDSRSDRSARKRGDDDWNSFTSGSSYPEKSKSAFRNTLLLALSFVVNVHSLACSFVTCMRFLAIAASYRSSRL